MGLKITDLEVDIRCLGEEFILTQVRPFYLYVNKEKTDKIAGYIYSCALPTLKFEKINIKVEQNDPLIKTDVEIPTGTMVRFDGLRVGSYYNFKEKQVNITASAKDIFLVENDNSKAQTESITHKAEGKTNAKA